MGDGRLISRYMYIRLKRAIAQADVYLFELCDDTSYKEDAYKQLRPLFKINWEDSPIIAELMETRLLFIETNLCSEEEIDHVLDLSENRIKELESEGDPSAIANSKIKLILLCEMIILDYKTNRKRVLELGIAEARDLLATYGDFLSAEDQKMVSAFWIDLELYSVEYQNLYENLE